MARANDMWQTLHYHTDTKVSNFLQCNRPLHAAWIRTHDFLINKRILQSSQIGTDVFSGQSCKNSTIEIYQSTVIVTRKFPILRF